MPRCNSPQPLQWTSFARLPPGRPARSPSPSPPSVDASLYGEASSTLSGSLILITPESSLLPDQNNVGVYDCASFTECKPSPSLICDPPELLPRKIPVALKGVLPAHPSHGLDLAEVAPVCDLSDEVEMTEQLSVAHGGFSDIYKGVWARPFCGEKGMTVVCIYCISIKWGSGLRMVAVVTGGNKIASSVPKAGGRPCTSTKGELLHYFDRPHGSWRTDIPPAPQQRSIRLEPSSPPQHCAVLRDLFPLWRAPFPRHAMVPKWHCARLHWHSTSNEWGKG